MYIYCQVTRVQIILEPLVSRLSKLPKQREPPHWAEYVQFQYNVTSAYIMNVLYLVYAQARGTLKSIHPCYTACATLKSGLEATSSDKIDQDLHALIESGEHQLSDELPVSISEARNRAQNKHKVHGSETHDTTFEEGSDFDIADADMNNGSGSSESDEEKLNEAALKLLKQASKASKRKKKLKAKLRYVFSLTHSFEFIIKHILTNLYSPYTFLKAKAHTSVAWAPCFHVLWGSDVCNIKLSPYLHLRLL